MQETSATKSGDRRERNARRSHCNMPTMYVKGVRRSFQCKLSTCKVATCRNNLSVTCTWHNSAPWVDDHQAQCSANSTSLASCCVGLVRKSPAPAHNQHQKPPSKLKNLLNCWIKAFRWIPHNLASIVCPVLSLILRLIDQFMNLFNWHTKTSPSKSSTSGHIVDRISATCARRVTTPLIEHHPKVLKWSEGFYLKARVIRRRLQVAKPWE